MLDGKHEAVHESAERHSESSAVAAVVSPNLESAASAVSKEARTRPRRRAPRTFMGRPRQSSESSSGQIKDMLHVVIVGHCVENVTEQPCCQLLAVGRRGLPVSGEHALRQAAIDHRIRLARLLWGNPLRCPTSRRMRYMSQTAPRPSLLPIEYVSFGLLSAVLLLGAVIASSSAGS